MAFNKSSNIRTVGAVAPSSQKLAEALTHFVSSDRLSQNIIEVGAGTGAITKKLLKKLGPEQVADVVEIMPSLFAILKKRFSDNLQLNLVCANILDFELDKKYDLIISSLPFNALEASMTEEIMERFVHMANDGAIISFFEYKYAPKIMPLILPKSTLSKYLINRSLIKNFLDKYKFDEKSVVLNLPPAIVHYLRIKK